MLVDFISRMIISHEHKFIFLKTRKTAGTSLDVALSRTCGPEDIISALNREGEALRARLGGRGAQNYRVPVYNWTGRDAARFLLKGRRPTYTEHMSAGSVRQRIEPDVWGTYFKFCVERNPFDKAISLYYWRTRSLSVRPPLLDFLRSIDRRSLSNFHIYAVDGALEVDYVIRYEELGNGLQWVTQSLGLSEMRLPKAKGGFREDMRHYREVMTSEGRAIVEEACAKEIELLGYEF